MTPATPAAASAMKKLIDFWNDADAALLARGMAPLTVEQAVRLNALEIDPADAPAALAAAERDKPARNA